MLLRRHFKIATLKPHTLAPNYINATVVLVLKGGLFLERFGSEIRGGLEVRAAVGSQYCVASGVYGCTFAELGRC